MRIDPAQHGWMTAPETLAVLAALGEARFVGGAVRNALLGAAVVDIDIAVPMPPSEAIARLVAKDIKVVETGIEHGTVTAIAGSHAFEITSLRRDVETDGRHAIVHSPTTGPKTPRGAISPSTRMYASADGEIFDYATGVEDLIAGRVRFMGDAATRIAEDYLRVLRLFRFHAWYGKGDIDAEGLRAAAAAKDKLKTLSAERVAKEMLRLLEAGNPAPVLRVMAATGILPELLPGALNLPRLERLAEIDADNLFAARCGAAAGGAAARQLTPRTPRRDALKLSNAAAHAAGTGAERRKPESAIVGAGGAAAALSHRRGALPRQGAAGLGGAPARRRRAGLAHAAGHGGTTGSGRAFR